MIGGLKQTTSRLAIAAAAGMFAGGIALTPAQAADLGGDCCADLEERVAELEATTVRKGNRKVSLKISGQVNRGILWWDDGHDTDVYLVDVNSSSTRLRFTGQATISQGRTAGFRLEYDVWGDATSDSVTNCGTWNATSCKPGGLRTEEFDSRWQDVWIKDDRLGKVSLGNGEMASDTVSEVDLSGFGASNLKSGADFDYTSFRFRTNGGGQGGVTYGTGWNNLDGLSRQPRIRYDTPSLGGFILSTSYSHDDMVDFAIRYAKEWNSVRCAAAYGVAHDTFRDDTTPGAVNDNDDIWTYSGSVSCLHTPSGLNLTFAAGDTDDSYRDNFANADDIAFWYIKAGIYRRWNSHGKTGIAIDFGQTENGAANGTTNGEMDIWGVGVIQNIDAAAMELYLVYRHAEYDDNTATNFEDLDFLMAGTRIKF